MSSDAWERCPNCSRNTKQDPVTASSTAHFDIPLFEKPRCELYVQRECFHCGTSYRVNYHLVLKNRVILKKGKEAWELVDPQTEA